MVARLTLVISLLLLTGFAALAQADVGARRDYSPVEYLKNYALASCLADGYQSDDAVAAANGYKELGSLDIEAYNAAVVLGRRFLARDYPSQSGEKLVLMKCVDLFHSKELATLARRYAKRK